VSARGISVAQMPVGASLTFSAASRRGVDNFSGSGQSALFKSNAAWTAALVETSQTCCTTHSSFRAAYKFTRMNIRPDSEQPWHRRRCLETRSASAQKLVHVRDWWEETCREEYYVMNSDVDGCGRDTLIFALSLSPKL
jgi:hypothetical protein